MANNLCISKTKLVRPQTTGWKREIEQNKTMQQIMLALSVYHSFLWIPFSRDDGSVTATCDMRVVLVSDHYS